MILCTQMPTITKHKALIEKIEKVRNSRVIVYVTGDRQPITAQIGDDIVRPMYDHALALAKLRPRKKKVDLFIYSRGGNVSIPWRIVTMLREHFDGFSVLVPYKCHSAATMVALGADEIVMGKKAELGPIDPTLNKASMVEGSEDKPSRISVEDVTSYISFIKDRANINDQAALAQLVSLLANHITPLSLGSVNREYSHIRLVARKLLGSHKTKIDDGRQKTIIEALTEKMYSHGHAIGRTEARELGLPIVKPNEKLEDAMWELFQAYEKDLKLNDHLDPETVLGTMEEKTLNDEPIALIESTEKMHVFEVNAVFTKQRKVPSNPTFNLNVTVTPPQGVQPNSPILQQLAQQLLQQLGAGIQQQLAAQSVLAGISIRMFGGKWKES